jgi:hypothetical protein
MVLLSYDRMLGSLMQIVHFKLCFCSLFDLAALEYTLFVLDFLENMNLLSG